MSDPTTLELDAPIEESVSSRRKKATVEVDTITRVNSRTAKKVRIIIPKTQNEKSDVYVAVNGTDFLIKRGIEVEVPDFVVNALRDSIETKMDMDGTVNDVPCYPFQIVG
jgi:hypothetical protein